MIRLTADWRILAIFGTSFSLLLVSLIVLLFSVISSSDTLWLIAFSVDRGVKITASPFMALAVWLLGVFVVLINAVLAELLFVRRPRVAYFLAIITLWLTLLILILIGVIISTN